MRNLTRALLAGSAAWVGLRAYGALRPTAYPHSAWPVLLVPRPSITRRRLLAILEPVAGEHVLEVGPGAGYYSLTVAERLEPGGLLDVLDIRQSFLDQTLRRARRRGLTNIVATLGEGDALPYPDGTFDAAYLITTLGEIPNADAALAELRRVLKSSGRLVIGEILIDPDFPRLGDVVSRAHDGRLRLDRRSGSPLAYYARFRPSPADPGPLAG